jgi:hypothetical protein
MQNAALSQTNRDGQRQDVQQLVEADGFHFPAFHFRAVPDQVAFAHREYS